MRCYRKFILRTVFFSFMFVKLINVVCFTRLKSLRWYLTWFLLYWRGRMWMKRRLWLKIRNCEFYHETISMRLPICLFISPKLSIWHEKSIWMLTSRYQITTSNLLQLNKKPQEYNSNVQNYYIKLWIINPYEKKR